MVQSVGNIRMKVLPSSLRLGNVIKEKNKLYAITRIQHTQPGKGGAYFQLEMRSVEEQTKQTRRVRASEELERANLFERKASFLFKDSDSFVFMDAESYDQVSVAEEIVGDASIFLTEGMVVAITFYEERVISAVLPSSVQVTVESADAVVKGQTATSSYKNAILENGMHIKVPSHISSGAAIMVDPNTGEYLEKA